MASDSVYGQLANFDVVAINNGELVRITANNHCVRAQADLAANLQGLAGASLSGIVGVFGVLNVASEGFSVRVRLEAGLVPVAGQTLYVSATFPGLATNVAPAIAVAIGTIEDVYNYTLDSRVLAVLAIPGAATGAGGAFPGFDPDGAVAMTNAGVSPLVARGDVIQRLIADWPLTTTRTFLLDPVNGNDANPGFSDAAGPFNAATQAKQTEAGMRKVFPAEFAGRQFRLLYARGAYATPIIANLLSGAGGWSTSVIRPTATDATAGAVAFADDAADRAFLGFTTATGMNAGGYNPIGALSATLIQCQINGGGAPGFAAEPALPGGVRIRFDSATTTVALRNVSRPITRVSGGDTLRPGTAFPAVPAATDVFYIEMPGTTLPSSVYATTGGRGILSIVGARYTGSLQLIGGNIRVSGTMCDTSFSATGNSASSISALYTDPDVVSIACGMSLRVGTTMSVQQAAGPTSFQSIWAVGAASWTNSVSAPTFTNGCTFAGGVSLTNISGMPTFIWNSTGDPTRIIGPNSVAGLLMNSASAVIDGLDITFAGALPGLDVRNNSFLIVTNRLTGTTGGPGATMINSSAAIISLASTPTLTGAGGDVQLRNGHFVTWAQAATTGIEDAAGNRLISPFIAGVGSSPLAVVGKFTGTVISDPGAAVFTYMADPGRAFVAPIANEVGRMGYPTSTRLITRLRVHALTAVVVQYTVTLYQNGAPTTMIVTVPALTAPGTKFVDAAHPILFADGDDFDLRVDMGQTEGGDQQLSAVLEGPC